MTKGSWQVRLTKTVAGEVRRYRKLRKMSGQALVDRCAQLGLAIPAAVLSNLELGRRESISIAELLVLAQALDVSPTLLIAPVATADKIEILPGHEADPMAVVDWFAGDARFDLTRTGLVAKGLMWVDRGPAGYVQLYRHHDMLVQLLQAEITEGRFVPGESGNVKERVDGGPGELRLVRRVMREEGLRVPDLPPELAGTDADGRGEPAK
jgi:transcriptional regulator with XRE-family HTH domain